MSKNCRIEFVEGELTCLCNHRDYRNCDLYKEDNETYDGWGTEGEMSKPSLIDLTNDDELMDRVLRKSAEMQNEILRKAEGK